MEKLMLCQERKIADWKDDNNYLLEKKEDGDRALIHIQDYKIEKIITRRGFSVLKSYPEFIDICFKIKSGIIDSEIIVPNKDFNEGIALRSHLKDEEEIKKRAKELTAKIIAFDILDREGEDLRGKKLTDRKAELLKAFDSTDLIDRVETYSDLKSAWAIVLENNFEGLIAKHKDTAYTETRSKFWIKLKNWKEKIIEFDKYENAVGEIGIVRGITLSNSDGIRCACLGRQSEAVKELLIKNGKIKVNCQYLEDTATGKLRFISFKEIAEEKIGSICLAI